MKFIKKIGSELYLMSSAKSIKKDTSILIEATKEAFIKKDNPYKNHSFSEICIMQNITKEQVDKLQNTYYYTFLSSIVIFMFIFAYTAGTFHANGIISNITKFLFAFSIILYGLNYRFKSYQLAIRNFCTFKEFLNNMKFINIFIKD